MKGYKKIKYESKNKRSIKIKSIIDFIGYNFFNRNKNIKINLKDINSITIVNMGHIGDIALMLPMIDGLRQYFKGEINLLVNSYTYEFAKSIKLLDYVYEVPHPSFSRGENISWYEAFKVFKSIKTDIVFDARSYFHSIPLSYLIDKKYLIGFDVFGFGFLLDVVLSYDYKAHITEKYFKFLEYLDIPRPTIKNLEHYINLEGKKYKDLKDYVAIGIGTGAQPKDWPDDYYIKLIEYILSKYGKNIVLLGKTSEERASKYNLDIERVDNLINKTSIMEAIDIIKNADTFIGLDSGLTHISAMLGIKTIAMYSGITRVGNWEPLNLNNNVRVIRKEVPCNYNGDGCTKTFCEDNICMKFIKPEDVLRVYEDIGS
ncbi:MAG: glycosyltransferase family 9 protein [Hydrogenobaculum sp.]